MRRVSQLSEYAISESSWVILDRDFSTSGASVKRREGLFMLDFEALLCSAFGNQHRRHGTVAISHLASKNNSKLPGLPD